MTNDAEIINAFNAYIEGVSNDTIIANKFVKQAVARHLNDMQTAEQRGLYFDYKAACRVVRFFSLLRHSKGKYAGQPFRLSPWQIFVVCNVFGWKWKATGVRRFRTAYLEVVRKQGKSTFAAGVALYCLVADEEQGGEVYSLATKREQASIVHGEAVRMVRKSPALRKTVKRRRGELSYEKLNGKFIPLGRDKDSLDGLNVSCAIVDEMHAIKDRELVEVIDSATGSRTQPLLCVITTAGSRRQGICYEQRQYVEKILAGTFTDDSVFGFIACLDEGDDIFDETKWPKAQVNLGISCSIEQMRIMARKAKELPTARASFARYCCGIWCEADVKRWISVDAWQACKKSFDDSELIGRPCLGGLDLAGTRDLSALLLLFPFENHCKVKLYCWAPKERAHERQHEDNVPYLTWAEQGLIKLTPGAVTDQDVIFADIEELKQKYDIEQICFDRFNAAKLANAIEKIDIEPTALAMTFTGISLPTKETESAIMGRLIQHDGNPVLSWAISNVVCASDDSGNIRPSKKRSIERIDPAVSLILAMAAFKFGGNKPETEDSTYNKNEMMFL